MSAAADNVLRSRAASEPRLTAALPRADTDLLSAVPTTAARNAAEPITVSRVLARRLALPALFVVAVAYHALQSLGHVTPTVFNDELLYGKLSQSIAAGDWFSIRGEHVFFPAILAPLVQSPAWLLGSTMDAYTAAKLINAALMSAAVFPAYWLAVRVVRPSFALLTAAAAVATPALFYHGYLMSEALAYPVFLGAIAVLAHAVQNPSRRTAVVVPLVCALAVATRVQFLILPLAYIATVAVCGRGQYRRHLVSCGSAAALVVLLLGVPGALGQYGEARHLGFSAGGTAHWALTNGYLLTYSLGLTVVVGAAFGIGFMLRRPRNHLERAVAALTLISTVLFIGQAAMIGGGEANRPLERYLFYVTPLVFLAFFAYAERAAPSGRAYLAATCLGALALSQVSFPGLTGTGAFFFDSVTLSAFARAAFSEGLPEASLIYSLAPIVVAVLALAIPLRRRGAPEFFAAVAIGLMAAMGAAVYATDRLATDWSVRTFGSAPPDWLDRSHLGPARYLVLPRANPLLGTYLESWNRTLTGVVVLGTAAPDPLPLHVARVAPDGSLEIDGKRAAEQVFVVNVEGSAIGLEGRVVARPRRGLVAYRIPAGAHVRWLATGLATDGWTGTSLHYRAWPARPGAYELKLYVPAGTAPRKVMVGKRLFVIRAGTPRTIKVPTNGAPLALGVDVPYIPLPGRVLGVKVRAIRFLDRSG
jgi:hypothetical protein